MRQIEWLHAPLFVTAVRGAILLTGFVEGYSLKIAAEESVRAVPGVELVINEIRLESPPFQREGS